MFEGFEEPLIFLNATWMSPELWQLLESSLSQWLLHSLPFLTCVPACMQAHPHKHTLQTLIQKNEPSFKRELVLNVPVALEVFFQRNFNQDGPDGTRQRCTTHSHGHSFLTSASSHLPAPALLQVCWHKHVCPHGPLKLQATSQSLCLNKT